VGPCSVGSNFLSIAGVVACLRNLNHCLRACLCSSAVVGARGPRCDSVLALVRCTLTSPRQYCRGGNAFVFQLVTGWQPDGAMLFCRPTLWRTSRSCCRSVNHHANGPAYRLVVTEQKILRKMDLLMRHPCAPQHLHYWWTVWASADLNCKNFATCQCIHEGIGYGRWTPNHCWRVFCLLFDRLIRA
jgi:hypothetical protein